MKKETRYKLLAILIIFLMIASGFIVMFYSTQ